MAFLAPIRFEGQIRRDDVVLEICFHAEVDEEGVLLLTFDELPASATTVAITRDRLGRRAEWMTLEGAAATGERIYSESFHITGRRQFVSEQVATVTLKGACSQAEIVRTLSKPAKNSVLVQFFPRFRAIHGLTGETDLGAVFMGGAESPSDDSQNLTAQLRIARAGAANPEWFEQARERLEHILRVMSFASGSYIRPLVERQIEGQEDRVYVHSRGATPPAFMPPFSFLNLGPIFAHACAVAEPVRKQFETLDPAIRWLLAPAHYDELRFITAVTALENLVDQAFPAERALFLRAKAFKRLASAVRAVLRGAGVDARMINKTAELNRRSFADKLEQYLAENQISLEGLDRPAIGEMIKARNTVVHSGVYYDAELTGQTDIWDHMLLARELAIRSLLGALDFVGNYFSPLAGVHQQLCFPSCRRLTDDNLRALPQPENATADLYGTLPNGF